MEKKLNEEIFPIVDEEGNVTGRAPRSLCHDGKSMLLHPVVHLHLFDSKGRLFLQKRSITKDIQPGKWDTSVGGHVAPSESINDALIRESWEELEIKDFKPQFMGRYIWQSSRERELVHSFRTVSDEIPSPDPSEIEVGKFWTMDEIRAAIGSTVFTPNFENEFLKFF